MPLYQPKIPVCVAIGCSGVALVLQIVAVAGTGWLTLSGSSGFGLFCVGDNCSFQFGEWLKACQAFSILAVLAIAGGLVLGILHIFKEDPKELILPARTCNSAAAACVGVEVAVFLGFTIRFVIVSSSLQTYGYCFYLSIVAGVLSAVSAGFHRSYLTGN